MTPLQARCSKDSNLLILPSPEKMDCLGLPDRVTCRESVRHRMDQQDELTALKDRNAELEARMNLVTALLHDSMSSLSWRIVYRYRQLADKWRWRRSYDRKDA